MSDLMSAARRQALRDALVVHVETSAATRPRRWWRRWPAATGVGVLLLGGGGAVAADVLLPPGADRVKAQDAEVTVVGAGDGTLHLGPAPADATHVEATFECLTPGVFVLDAVIGSVECTAADVLQSTGTTTYTVPLGGERSTTSVATSPDARWTVTAHYATREATPWAVNPRGETYGVTRADGTEPDLVAVEIGTSGHTGYVYAGDLHRPGPASPADAPAADDLTPVPVPIYEPEGWTVIGVFTTSGRLLQPGEPAPSRPPWASPRP